MLATVLSTIQLGIVCLRETKSTCTDPICSLNWHFYLSGDAADPHARVGFGVPQYLLPLVYDFIPLTARIAILKLATKPFPFPLFSVYASSKLPVIKKILIVTKLSGVPSKNGTGISPHTYRMRRKFKSETSDNMDK